MAINSATINGAAVNATSGSLLAGGGAIQLLTAVGSGRVIVPPTVGAITLPNMSLSGHISSNAVTTNSVSIVGRATVGISAIGGGASSTVLLPVPVPNVSTVKQAIVGLGIVGTATLANYGVAGMSASGAGTIQGLYLTGSHLGEGRHAGVAKMPRLLGSGRTAATAAVYLQPITATGGATFVDTYGALSLFPATANGVCLSGLVLATGNTAVRISALGQYKAAISSTITGAIPKLGGAGSIVSSVTYVGAATTQAPTVTANVGAFGATAVAALRVAGTTTVGTVMSMSAAVAALRVAGTTTVGTVMSMSAAVAALRVAGTTTVGTVMSSATTTLQVVASGSLITTYGLTGTTTVPSLTATGLLRLPVISNASIAITGIVGNGSLSTLAYGNVLNGVAVQQDVVMVVNTHTGASTTYQLPAIIGARDSNLIFSDGAAVYECTDVSGADAASGGTLLTWSYLSTATDIGTHHRKRLDNVWFGGIGAPNLVITTDGTVERRLLGGVSLTGTVERRVKVPKGIRSVYYQIGATGVGAARINRVTVEPIVLSRRVR